jgi:hypothetical protein
MQSYSSTVLELKYLRVSPILDSVDNESIDSMNHFCLKFLHELCSQFH